ncbi:MAG: Hsp20/alpha crystallin family protein [Phycisphaerales bacterium]|nr:Hsp20/alpha crystallin family protein [Phycisphaerales bacterium]
MQLLSKRSRLPEMPAETRMLRPSSLVEFRNEMDRWIDRLFTEPFSAMLTESIPPPGVAPMMALKGEWVPPTDIVETEKTLVLKVELPGVEPSKLSLHVTEEYLTLSGEKEELREAKEESFVATERRYGSFFRRIALPVPVDPEKVKAEYVLGVLKIVAEKAPQARGRKVAITTAGVKPAISTN